MIEVGILKNFDSGTYKAGVQLAGSLTTYFDDINVAKNIPSSALVIGNYVILAIPGGNPKDACVIATWPGGSPGGGTFLDLSDTPSSYSGQAGKYVKVNQAANALEFGLIATKFTLLSVADYMFRQDAVCDSSFEAQINGNPTPTSVVYDNDLREDSLPSPSFSQFGKVILHNITRGNSRKITSVNTSTNTITTEESNDDWANDDVITTASQTCVLKLGHNYSYFFDIDASAAVPATATAALFYFLSTNLSGTANPNQDHLCYHPYSPYTAGNVAGQVCSAAYQSEVVWPVLPVVDQKVCLAFGPWRPVTASGMQVIAKVKGYWE